MEENGCRAWHLNLFLEQLFLLFYRLLGYNCSSELGRILLLAQEKDL